MRLRDPRVIFAVVILASCSTPGRDDAVVAPDPSPPSVTRSEASCIHATRDIASATGTIRSELRVAAHRFVDLARGRVDCRLADALPVDTPVGLYLGNAHQHTIASDAIGTRSEWNMCVAGYGRSCPTSPLDTIAAMRGKPTISYRVPHRCLATLAERPAELGGSHVVVLHPAKPRSCASSFAVEIWMNDVGQVTSVNLLLAPTSSTTDQSASTRVVPHCDAADVRLSVAKTAAVMSQPFADIALTSNRTTSCVLSGYPRIRARGFLGEDQHGEPVALALSVHRGLYERADPGPRRVVLRPHHPLFFSVGTASAYQGGLHPITLTRLIVVLPGAHVSMTLPIDLLATKPADRRIPVGITAITASPHA